MIRRSIETERRMSELKDCFEFELKKRLHLTKVMAPLYVSRQSGMNDNLNGVERPVAFELNQDAHEIVHSLAKWKRAYLKEIDAEVGEGIVADMRAIRADEVVSDIHSNYVDQWDWEKVISKEERSLSTLVKHATGVYEALKATALKVEGGILSLPSQLTIVHTEELLQQYPELSPKEREDKAAQEWGAILLIGIGGHLSDGKAHDLRAPDYDDWTTENAAGYYGLNADIIVWDGTREKSLELSSMGVRVDKEALIKQLQLTGTEERISLPFHKALLEEKLPFTIGGGIGQSRVAMFLLRKKGIQEVQPVMRSLAS